ncbi:hypothetical protein KEM48_006440 [Puccinia striiformis f. sp. tritici PST-130]|uniref:NADH dehydrogenase [ubiquinone] 1 alpha subcomplex assembly factor 3 n=1 Tax=Puccinia striiformis f. sp. tritici PST-78 TaxID=1165861 RepID=A0A0L0W1F6_9BASI|nr:hypothetical protein KEM48_006440 [Puccinia striiformis f. sp. tritici PST-130]KNF05307.1 hypothetical protein PSTG_01522 [Puccinia striiformis f. sp. tritici PST-78]
MQGIQRLSKSLQQLRQSSSMSKFINIFQQAQGKSPGQTEEGEMLSVQSVHERAFTLSNDTIVPANLFLYNACGMLWNPAPDIYSSLPDHVGFSKIASQFKLFEIIHPRPEMVILGAGKSILTIEPAKIAAIKAYLNSIGIQLDVLDTRNGCSNYNFLVEEGRSVAGLFLTLEPVDSLSSQLLSPTTTTNNISSPQSS